MLEHGGAQSWASRNDDPRPGLVFNCRGHQKPRSLLAEDEVIGVVAGAAQVMAHGSSLVGKSNKNECPDHELLICFELSVISYLLHCSSGGQVMPKILTVSLQSDRTALHSSLHGRITVFSSMHAGKKAWHKKWWTLGEHWRFTNGMKG